MKEFKNLQEACAYYSKYDFHGGPFNRGSADAYYGRRYDPHWYPKGNYNEPRIDATQMTAEELDAYTAAYELEDDRKY